jgi:hypothetical protein
MCARQLHDSPLLVDLETVAVHNLPRLARKLDPQKFRRLCDYPDGPESGHLLDKRIVFELNFVVNGFRLYHSLLVIGVFTRLPLGRCDVQLALVPVVLLQAVVARVAQELIVEFVHRQLQAALEDGLVGLGNRVLLKQSLQLVLLSVVFLGKVGRLLVNWELLCFAGLNRAQRAL